MIMTDRGLLALARHEGIVPAPYLDVKQVWTFGVGHTAAAGAPDPGRLPRGMPADLNAGVREALRLFRADLAKYEAEVLRVVTVSPARHEFDVPVRFDADRLDVTWDLDRLGSIASIPLVEVRR